MFLFCGLTSLLTFIMAIILSVKTLGENISAIDPDNIFTIFMVYYVVTSVLTFLPWLTFILYSLKETSAGKFLFGDVILRKFYNKLELFIDVTHQCNEMMLIANNEVNYNYYMDKLSIAARRGLAQILLFTNNYIAQRYLDGISYKNRRILFKKLDYYLTEFNGAIIVSFKGRVPKYITDVFEQITANIIDLRKNEY